MALTALAAAAAAVASALRLAPRTAKGRREIPPLSLPEVSTPECAAGGRRAWHICQRASELRTRSGSSPTPGTPEPRPP
eukprot:13358288-Alexandrium_andersonii.AAC.1